MRAFDSIEEQATIGAKLGAILQNQQARADFIKNSEKVLAEVGIKTKVAIHADSADVVHLVVPADVDETRVAIGDEAYFEELGQLALGICYYEDLPE